MAVGGRLSHPVVWLGWLASQIETRWNKGSNRFIKGLIGWALIVGLAAGLGAVLQLILLSFALSSPSNWGAGLVGLVSGRLGLLDLGLLDLLGWQHGRLISMSALLPMA